VSACCFISLFQVLSNRWLLVSAASPRSNQSSTSFRSGFEFLWLSGANRRNMEALRSWSKES
jgi:hypothetical protein